MGIQPDIEVALSDPLGGTADLSHRHDDGIHKVGAGVQNEQQDGGGNQGSKNSDEGKLPVNGFHRNDIPQPQQVFAGEVCQHRDGHDLLIAPGAGIAAGTAAGGFGLLQVRHAVILRQKAAGSQKDLAPGIDGHQLNAVLILKILHQRIKPGGKIGTGIGGIGLQPGG